MSNYPDTVWSLPANSGSPNSSSSLPIGTLQSGFVDSLRGLNNSLIRQFWATKQPSSAFSNDGYAGDSFDTSSVNDATEDPISVHSGAPGRGSGLATSSDPLTRTSVPSYLQSLPDLPLQRELLEHWALVLVDTILPIPVLKNPLRNFISPIAMSGAESVTGSSSPQIAVFHLICSESAFHLCWLRGDSRLRSISLRHHDSGIKHLRRCVSTTDPQHYIALLAAFGMCLINETLSVGTPFWHVHVRGACTWLSQIDSSHWSKSEATATIYQLFLGMAPSGWQNSPITRYLAGVYF